MGEKSKFAHSETLSGENLRRLEEIKHSMNTGDGSDSGSRSAKEHTAIELDPSANKLPVTDLLDKSLLEINSIHLDEDELSAIEASKIHFEKFEDKAKSLNSAEKEKIRNSHDYAILQNYGRKNIGDVTINNFIDILFKDKSINRLAIELFLLDQKENKALVPLTVEKAPAPVGKNVISRLEGVGATQVVASANQIDITSIASSLDRDTPPSGHVPVFNIEKPPLGNVVLPESSAIKSVGENPTNENIGVSEGVVELKVEKSDLQPKSEKISEEEKAARDWLVGHLGLNAGEVYGELRGEKRELADKKLVEQTVSLWSHFIEQKKWHYDEKTRRLEIEEKQLGDIEAKVVLGFLKKAGLDKHIQKYSSSLGSDKDKVGQFESVWANTLESQEFTGFDEGLVSKDKATAAEVFYRILTAGQVINKDDEAFWSSAVISHKTIYNEIINNKEQFESSPRTLRGMNRFMSYGSLNAYIRNNWEGLKSVDNTAKLDELLDREISDDDIKSYDLVRKLKGKWNRNSSAEQAKVFDAASKILSKDEIELRQEGHVVDSAEWGKLFVNVASAGDGFPGGATAVKAWGGYDGYLQIDEKNNSFLFRTFNTINTDKAKALDLPGGKWVYNMYMKMRGSAGEAVNLEHFLKVLGVKKESAPDIREGAGSVETQPVVASEIKKRDWLDSATGIEFDRSLTESEIEVKDRVEKKVWDILLAKAKSHPKYSGAKDKSLFETEFVSRGFLHTPIAEYLLDRYKAEGLPVK